MKLSPDALMAAPELGPLAVLDVALDVAVFALAAAWPELQVGDADHDETRAAVNVIKHARRLAAAVRRYRRDVVASRRRHLDLPF